MTNPETTKDLNENDVMEPGTTEPKVTEPDVRESETKHPRKCNTRKTLALALWLGISTIFSACSTSASDVAEKGRQVEVVGQSIEQYIKYRHEIVKKYNELVRKSKLDPDNIPLQEEKALRRDEIKKTDKTIKKLWKKYIRKTNQYNKSKIKAIDGCYWLDEELPEDTFDFMIDMINN